MPSMFRAYTILRSLRDGGVDSFRARSQSLTRWRGTAKGPRRGSVELKTQAASQTGRRPNGFEVFSSPMARSDDSLATNLIIVN